MGEGVRVCVSTLSEVIDVCMCVCHCVRVCVCCRYEHVVFVLDALIYTLTHWPKSVTIQTDQSHPSKPPTTSSSPRVHPPSTTTESLQMEHTSASPTATTTATTTGSNDRFFQRSESILANSGTSESEGDHEAKKSNQNFFDPRGAVIESPDFVGNREFWGDAEKSFSQPLSEAYPLAQQPHLLGPHAKKERLFSSQGWLGAEGGREGGREGRDDGKRGRRGLPVSYDSTDGRLVQITCLVFIIKQYYSFHRFAESRCEFN